MTTPFPTLRLDRSSSEPLYDQLRAALKNAIETGRLTTGTRLPAERDLAMRVRVSRTTVATAYRELEDLGLLRSHVGRGTFVCAVPDSAHAPFAWRGKISARARRGVNLALRHLIDSANNPDLISFAAGFPAVDLFPTTAFRRMADQVLARDTDSIVKLAPAHGQLRLREVIAQRFKVSPNRVMIVSGATEALSLIARCLLDKGDAVIMDRPGYVGAIQNFHAAGANLVGWDIRNADFGELEDLLLRYRPKFIYTNPTFQNPTGHTLPERDRRDLLKLASRYRIPVVEDDPYRAGYFDAPPPKSLHELDGESLVMYLSTFSKLLAPGLRLGWIIASDYMIDQLALIKEQTTLFTEGLGQLIMAEFIRSGAYDKHVALVRTEHRVRCHALFEAMQRYLPSRAVIGPRPVGGIFFWGRLGGAMKSSELLQKALTAGVAFAPGEIFYPDQSGSEHLRLCFANLHPEQIEEGVKRLAQSFTTENSHRDARTEKKLPMV